MGHTLKSPSSLTMPFWPKLGLKPFGFFTCSFGLAQSRDKVTCLSLTANATLCHTPSFNLSLKPARTGALPRRLYSNSTGFKLKDRLCFPSIIVNKSALLSVSTFTVANKTNSAGKPLGKSASTVVLIVVSVEDRSYATSNPCKPSWKGSGLFVHIPIVSMSSSLKLHWNSCTTFTTSEVSEISKVKCKKYVAFKKKMFLSFF